MGSRKPQICHHGHLHGVTCQCWMLEGHTLCTSRMQTRIQEEQGARSTGRVHAVRGLHGCTCVLGKFKGPSEQGPGWGSVSSRNVVDPAQRQSAARTVHVVHVVELHELVDVDSAGKAELGCWRRSRVRGRTGLQRPTRRVKAQSQTQTPNSPANSICGPEHRQSSPSTSGTFLPIFLITLHRSLTVCLSLVCKRVECPI